MLPIIVIGCPVQNREKAINFYLESIYNLDYPKKNIILAFFVNNSKDNTERIIRAFFRSRGEEYKECHIWVDNKVYKGKVDGQHRIKRDFTLFSIVRNRYLSYINQLPFDYLFSVDSDILLEPKALKELLAEDKDICSALVFNGRDWGVDWYNYRVYEKNPMTGKEDYYIYPNLPRETFKVDLTGACVLIKKEVLDSGVKYKPYKKGEDLPFCWDAQKKGFEIYCNPNIKTTHLLTGDKR